MKFGFVGPSYTAKSNAVADEECINFFAETNETPGAQTQRSYFGTPGLNVFATFDEGSVRGQCWTGDRLFVAANDTLYEVFADGTNTKRMGGTLDLQGAPVSIAFSNIELLIVAGGRAWAYELADNTFTDITSQLAGEPIKVKYSDGYFIVIFARSNKFQISAILDGTSWPGLQVNAVSVFAENIVSIEVSHRELWVIGGQHAQPYQDTGTDEIFDVIPGALIETGGAATFGVDLVDNTVFWISEDIRGARQAWRANGYTPSRISTHAVEIALSSYTAAQITNLVSYSYQDGGHLFWVLYIPGTDCTWVYDVAESLWHKRAEWQVQGGGSRTYTNASGQIWMVHSRPLDNENNGIIWSDFALGGPLPGDAEIQAIYPVIIASGHHDGAVQRLGYGINIPYTQIPPWNKMLHPFDACPISPGQDIANIEFYGPTIGTSLSDLTDQDIGADLDQSIPLNNMTDYMQITAVGFLVVYNSANPVIGSEMPLPFALAPGQGAAWAVPATAIPNELGQAINITSSQLSGGIATYEYTPITGPALTPGQILTVAGTTNAAGGLNGAYLTVLTVSGSFFTTSGPGGSAALQAEMAVAIIGDAPTTGAAAGAPASLVIIPPSVVAEGTFGPHRSWNHSYAFGKHLVGDWKSPTLWEMKLPIDNGDGTYQFVTDNGSIIRRVRRSPTLVEEMEWIYGKQLTIDVATGLGPQPPLVDGDGNPRPPQLMLRWSNTRGSTWSNEHLINCGYAGEYSTRVIQRRLGRWRYRVFEVVVTDPIPWAIVDAYLETA